MSLKIDECGKKQNSPSRKVRSEETDNKTPGRSKASRSFVSQQQTDDYKSYMRIIHTYFCYKGGNHGGKKCF